MLGYDCLHQMLRQEGEDDEAAVPCFRDFAFGNVGAGDICQGDQNIGHGCNIVYRWRGERM